MPLVAPLPRLASMATLAVSCLGAAPPLLSLAFSLLLAGGPTRGALGAWWALPALSKWAGGAVLGVVGLQLGISGLLGVRLGGGLDLLEWQLAAVTVPWAQWCGGGGRKVKGMGVGVPPEEGGIRGALGLLACVVGVWGLAPTLLAHTTSAFAKAAAAAGGSSSSTGVGLVRALPFLFTFPTPLQLALAASAVPVEERVFLGLQAAWLIVCGACVWWGVARAVRSRYRPISVLASWVNHWKESVRMVVYKASKALRNYPGKEGVAVN